MLITPDTFKIRAKKALCIENIDINKNYLLMYKFRLERNNIRHADIFVSSCCLILELINFLRNELRVFYDCTIFAFEEIKSIETKDKRIDEINFEDLNIVYRFSDQYNILRFESIELSIVPNTEFDQSIEYTIKENSNQTNNFPKDRIHPDTNIISNKISINYVFISCSLCEEKKIAKFISNMLFAGNVCKDCYEYLNKIEWPDSRKVVIEQKM